MRITRQDAERLGLDYDDLWDRARPMARPASPFAPSPLPVLVIPGQPTLVSATRGPGWWEGAWHDWRPASLNELMRSVRHRSRLKKRDRGILRMLAETGVVPPASSKRRVSLRIILPKGQRRWDKDAFWKSILDGLSQVGLLVDDRPDYCEPGTVDYERGENLATTIRLEELR